MCFKECFLSSKEVSKYDFRMQTTVSIFDENKSRYLKFNLLSKDVDWFLV